jgi:hypothetical protein
MRRHNVSTFRTILLTIVTLVAGAAFAPATASAQPSRDGKRSADRPTNVHHDTSQPLRNMQPAPDRPAEEVPEHHVPPPPTSDVADPVRQDQIGAAAAPAPLQNFLGVGKGFTGPAGSFSVQFAPPDTDGDVGPNHYFQIVNSSIAIFTKTGTPIYGPVKTRTLWSGFGGQCQSRNDGDGIVKYDAISDRWVVTQFAVGTAPYLECVAVSTTGDPTGSYHRYSFSFTQFPDYPKLAVWPDAYYITYNRFIGNAFTGVKACAYDRTRMLAGLSATQQCFDLGTSFGSLLASDLDGPTLPPAGSPNYVMEIGSSQLNLWKFHVDWATPGNSGLNAAPSIGVAAYSPACGGGSCVPQSGTTTRLDSLGERLMHRLAYRNFGDHESLVVNHSISSGGSVGVRWYEVRSPGAGATMFQQGTYAPDSAYRWMGSIAMDGSGNIGLGFSISSGSLHPGVHYTGHLTTDPPGVMGQGEGVLFNGPGSQTGGLDRWGDYSAMAIDPVDDCTFWYTNEYLPANGSFNWSTRIGSFKLPGCGVTTPDFSLSASPSSQTVAPGAGTSYGVTITPSNGFADPVSLSVTGLPTDASGSFSPNPATTSSSLSVTTALTTPPGTYPLTITGTSGALTHTTAVTLVVSGGGGGDFTISSSPTGRTGVVRGSTTTFTITITPSGGFTGSVTLSASGGQPGSTYSFSPNPTTSTATLTVQTSASGPTGKFVITITGTSGSLVHTTTVNIGVTT